MREVGDPRVAEIMDGNERGRLALRAVTGKITAR